MAGDKRTVLPAHHYKDNPNDQKRWFTAKPFSGILEELAEILLAKARDSLRFSGPRTTWPTNWPAD